MICVYVLAVCVMCVYMCVLLQGQEEEGKHMCCENLVLVSFLFTTSFNGHTLVHKSVFYHKTFNSCYVWILVYM